MEIKDLAFLFNLKRFLLLFNPLSGGSLEKSYGVASGRIRPVGIGRETKKGAGSTVTRQNV
jgi:hypothetical protein